MYTPENNSLEIPPTLMIDSMRNEVANLNDQRIKLIATVEWQKQVIDALKHQLDQASNDVTTDEVTTQVDSE